MTAHLIVRAEVLEAAVKDDFDRWYSDEHLPDCVKAFGARRAWRGWSEATASVHFAVYEFDDVVQVRAILRSEALKAQAAEFDRAWGDRVRRSREVVEVIQTIGA
jgi:hypothetical protein